MATRFYLPTTEAAPITGTTQGSWTSTASVVDRKLRDVKGADAMAAGPLQSITSGAGNHTLDRRYISAQLNGAQSVSGTVKGELQVLEGAATDNIDRIYFGLFVVDAAGTTLRGTLLAVNFYATNTEFGTAFAQRRMADGDTVTTVSASDGDRIQLELGFGMSATGTTPQAQAEYGQAEADLLDAGSATTGSPWIELSSVTLAFQAPPAAAAFAMMME
jgi:hypothetical protein